MLRTRILALAILLFFSQRLLADVPEYQYFGDREKAEINAPRLVGAEYESDRLTYQFLSSWNALWLNQSKVFQYTAGSLGPTRFYTRGRFRFREKLSESFDFMLTYAEVGDPKQTRQSLIFEFVSKPWEFLHLALYGQPSTLKKEDDIGLAAIFNFKPQSTLRFFYTAVDFSHNKRNEEGDYYKQKPYSTGLVWRHWDESCNEFIELSYRHDSQVEQIFESGRIYSFQGDQLRGISRHSINQKNSKYLQTEFNFSKGYEGDTLNTDQGINRWEYKHADAMIQLENLNHWFHLVGLRVNHSGWKSVQGSVIHNDLLPHSWFRLFREVQGNTHQFFDIGYEFTWHRGQGSSSLRSDLDTNNKVEHRMNWRYQLISFQNTRLNFLLTFDLDRFGSGETWEGGSMQYSMFF